MNRLVVWSLTLLGMIVAPSLVAADPPVASYLFPAGGQRGQTVSLRLGGLFLKTECRLHGGGDGVAFDATFRRVPTLWFEGPLLPLNESQRSEDYPKDMTGQVRIAANAGFGVRTVAVSTAEGVSQSLRFVVGDLPEVVEDEQPGEAVPVRVTLPVTVNGRIFPHEDIDEWEFLARQGQSVTVAVEARRFGSPLQAHLEVIDAADRVLTESSAGGDPRLRFVPPKDGPYRVRIRDIRGSGGQAFVYRLTLTTGPWIDHIFPLGGRRGTTVALHVQGQRLPNTPIPVRLPAQGETVTMRLPTTDGPSQPVVLDLDDGPEYVSPTEAGAINGPAVLNGRVVKPGHVDEWSLTGRKGDAWTAELRAAQLGSPLLGVLTLLGPDGREVVRAESPDGQSDPILRATLPTDGTYRLRVADQFRHRGGPAFAYRVRLSPTGQPDFQLRLAGDTVTVQRNGQPGKVRVIADRQGGFTEAIQLRFDGLPPGVMARPSDIPAGQTQVDVEFKEAVPATPVTVTAVTVRGRSRLRSGDWLERVATVPVERGRPAQPHLWVGLGLTAPFRFAMDYEARLAPRGTTQERRYRIQRNGFDGPLTVSLSDRQTRHLQGASGADVSVSAGASECVYRVTLPAWIDTGRTSRVCLMMIGEVRDVDGHTHAVSYSSNAQNDQVIVIVEPGRLSLTPERATLTVAANRTVELPVTVARAQGLTGPVSVAAIGPSRWTGAVIEPIEIAAGQTRGVLRVRFTADARPPREPLTLRATLPDPSGPIVAEATVAVLNAE